MGIRVKQLIKYLQSEGVNVEYAHVDDIHVYPHKSSILPVVEKERNYVAIRSGREEGDYRIPPKIVLKATPVRRINTETLIDHSEPELVLTDNRLSDEYESEKVNPEMLIEPFSTILEAYLELKHRRRTRKKPLGNQLKLF